MDEMRGVVIRWLKLAARPSEKPTDLCNIDYAKAVRAQDLVAMVNMLQIPFDFRGREQTRVMGDKLKRYKDQVFEIETSKGVMPVTLHGAKRENAMRWYLEFEGYVDPDPMPF